MNSNGKRLNESQRCEIIAKLSKTSTPSKRSLAREYGVSEGAVWGDPAFEGFEVLYEQILDIEDQLLCREVQIEANETFDYLKKSFEVFQNKLRTLLLRAKRKKLHNLRQMTIRDMLAK
jgi:hypothetical protein